MKKAKANKPIEELIPDFVSEIMDKIPAVLDEAEILILRAKFEEYMRNKVSEAMNMVPTSFDDIESGVLKCMSDIHNYIMKELKEKLESKQTNETCKPDRIA